MSKSLKKFCKNLIKVDGFILVDANSNEYIIGKPEKDIPIKLKILDKSLHYKLLLLPDLYLGIDKYHLYLLAIDLEGTFFQNLVLHENNMYR